MTKMLRFREGFVSMSVETKEQQEVLCRQKNWLGGCVFSKSSLQEKERNYQV